MLLTENYLDEWVRGNREEAKGVIVELIWRLVAASSPGPRERRFPLGDSIGQHGQDGFLDANISYKPFVPEGKSFWEIGTSLRSRDKATEDYRDLTKAVPKQVRSESNFIFVTPYSAWRDWEHTWKENAQLKWIESRIQKKEWKDVNVIDATKIIDWLRHFPAVELWLLRKMKKDSTLDIETPEQIWTITKSIGEPPPLIPELFLTNRSDATKMLDDLFQDNIRKVKLATHHPNQIKDFVSAYHSTLDEEKHVEVAGRCLIVNSETTWVWICDESIFNDFILIADPSLDLNGENGTKLIQKASRSNHSIVFSGTHGGIPDPASVKLPMPSIYQVQEALKNTGYNEERARLLSQRSGGNLGSLLRCILNLSALPEWAEGDESSDLKIAAALGSWSESTEADREIVENLSGKDYGEWVRIMNDVANQPSTPLMYSNGVWKFIPKYEGWFALGPRFIDEDLENIKRTAINVLGEKDPQFELPPSERYLAVLHEKKLMHSKDIRKGLSDTITLLGSFPEALINCSPNHAKNTATTIVRDLLLEATWELWMSLDDHLPLLAEASPDEFLNAVEQGLLRKDCPFDEMFKQEDTAITGRTYMSGLLWALETLAWDSDYLNRVVICLGDLAARDIGGNWSNRPINSLKTIFLSWLPQTCADIPKRVASIRSLLNEQPKIGWKLLQELLPEYHSFSIPSRRPSWRPIIPGDWKEGVSGLDYIEQVQAYVKLAIDEVKKDLSKLPNLIEHLDRIPPAGFDQIIDHLNSTEILDLPGDNRLPLWNQLNSLLWRHKKYPAADWVMDSEKIKKLQSTSDLIKPEDLFLVHQRLFSESDFDLFDTSEDDYTTQIEKLEKTRQNALSELVSAGGLDEILRFNKIVESSIRVGVSFGAIAETMHQEEILPRYILSDDTSLTQFTSGFIRGKFHNYGWDWVEDINYENWTSPQTGQFFSYLPFNKRTWDQTSERLEEDEVEYWLRTPANPYETDENHLIAVGKLLDYERPKAALRSLHHLLYKKKPIDRELAIRALLEAVTSTETPHSLDHYDTAEIIKTLQQDEDIDPDKLFHIEWAYLPLLDGSRETLPRHLWRKLSTEPEFFCEMIRLVFKPREEEKVDKQISEEKKIIATNAYRLISEWAIPPGLQEDGSFDGNHLDDWLEAVKRDCSETGHLEIALVMIGHVLTHVPPDPDGLWINHSAASVLNQKDANDMRSGFRTELYNSRGVHFVDPSGKKELELADKYQKMAENVENSGYFRLATTLRNLAEDYVRQANRISSRHTYDDY